MKNLNDSVTVRPDGKISLPLVGTVVAEGKAPKELESKLAVLYREYYKNARPVLIVWEFTNNQFLVGDKLVRAGLKNIDDVVVLTRTFERLVFVAGEVGRPGFVKLKGPMTVSQAVIGSGGVKRTAELRTAVLFHKGDDGCRTATTLNMRGLWRPDKPQPMEDLALQPCDVTIIPKTRIARVNDALDQYIYQLLPMAKNTSFQYVYTTGASVGLFSF